MRPNNLPVGSCFAAKPHPKQIETSRPIRPPRKLAEALSKVEIGEFVRRLKAYNGSRTVVIAIWLLLYTASRTIEIRRAEWTDFQLDEGLWTIPANKMKNAAPTPYHYHDRPALYCASCTPFLVTADYSFPTVAVRQK